MKNFKYLLIMIVALTISVSSCSNDNHEYHLEKAIVTNAVVPEEFIYGKTYELDVTIELLTSCHFFYNQYDYLYDGPSRLIYPIAHVDKEDSCAQEVSEATFTIPIDVRQSEPYIFKFYQGEDAEGEDQFLTIEVPVI